MKAKYHSCFIVDVNINDKYVELTDSARGKYYIDVTNASVMEQFKTWLKNDFIAGLPQHATVFKYSTKDEEGAVEIWIEKFFLKEQEPVMLNETK